MSRGLLFCALLALGCPRRVPDHLQVNPTETQVESTMSFTSRTALVRHLIGTDPLVRAPRLPDRGAASEHDAGIAEWAQEVKALEQGDGNVAVLMHQLEQRHPHSEVVPLSRGYRLRRAENQVANLTGTAPAESGPQLASLLTPLKASEVTEGLNRSPLAFLGDDTSRGVRTYGERWVLSGWLTGPDIDLAPVRDALAGPQFDGLSASPVGQIVANSGRGSFDENALADLERATLLSLTRAAADRDNEQASWAALKEEAATELSAKDPEAALLSRAFDGLVRGTGDPRALSAAWTASAALRWLEDCPDKPCAGLDRTASFTHAAGWSDDVAHLARVWQVIALKDGLDTMEVGHDTILYPKASVQLLDALLGTGAGPFDMSVLQKSRSDQGVWLELARSVGAERATDWSTARSALSRHLAAVTADALEANPDNAFTPLLERIARRAE